MAGRPRRVGLALRCPLPEAVADCGYERWPIAIYVDGANKGFEFFGSKSRFDSGMDDAASI